MTPVERAGEQADRGGREDDPEDQSQEPGGCRSGGALTQPAEAEAAEHDREEKGRDSDGL